jgi:hypothetical protein
MPVPPSPGGRSGTARLGLGLAAVGRPAYITSGRDADLPADRSPAALEQRAHALLDAAATAGIRYVDAARSYGGGPSSSWPRGCAAVPTPRRSSPASGATGTPPGGGPTASSTR